MSNVYVLGAGASTEYKSVKNLPVPTDKTFWSIVDIISKGDPPDKINYEELKRIIKVAFNVSSFEKLNQYGLEKAFSLIKEKSDDDYLKFQELLEWVLFYVIRSIDKDNAKVHCLFVNKKLNPGDTIITFNYDVIIDQIVWESAKKEINDLRWHPSTGYGCDFNCYYNQFIPNSTELFPLKKMESNVFIYKLHGSLGWIQQANDPMCLYLQDSKSDLKLAQKGYIKRSVIIIPPIKNKKISASIELIWNKAKVALEEANKIYFIGYRFPKTDESSIELFRNTCSDKSVEIVLTTRDKVKKAEELGSLFPGIKPENIFCGKFSEWLKLKHQK